VSRKLDEVCITDMEWPETRWARRSAVVDDTVSRRRRPRGPRPLFERLRRSTARKECCAVCRIKESLLAIAWHDDDRLLMKDWLSAWCRSGDIARIVRVRWLLAWWRAYVDLWHLI